MNIKTIDLTDLVGKPLDEIREALLARITEAVAARVRPCQQPPMDDAPPRLLRLIYKLLRDEMEAGGVEQMLVDDQSASAGDEYCNPHLEALARAYCTHLVGEDYAVAAAALKTLDALKARLETAGVWDEETHGLAAIDKLVEQAKVTDQPLLDAITAQLDRAGVGAGGLGLQSRIAELISWSRTTALENDRLARDHQADRAKLELYGETLDLMRRRADEQKAIGGPRLPTWYREQIAVALGEIPANDAQG